MKVKGHFSAMETNGPVSTAEPRSTALPEDEGISTVSEDEGNTTSSGRESNMACPIVKPWPCQTCGKHYTRKHTLRVVRTESLLLNTQADPKQHVQSKGHSGVLESDAFALRAAPTSVLSGDVDDITTSAPKPWPCQTCGRRYATKEGLLEVSGYVLLGRLPLTVCSMRGTKNILWNYGLIRLT